MHSFVGIERLSSSGFPELYICEFYWGGGLYKTTKEKGWVGLDKRKTLDYHVKVRVSTVHTS